MTGRDEQSQNMNHPFAVAGSSLESRVQQFAEWMVAVNCSVALCVMCCIRQFGLKICEFVVRFFWRITYLQHQYG
jgi:hypothetical protein